MSQRLGMADGRCFTVTNSSKLYDSFIMQKNGITDRDAFIEFAKSYDMDGNKYLKGSELGAAAVDFVAKDAPAEEAPAEEESADDSSEDGEKEPEVVWRNSGDSQDAQ